MGYVEVEKQLTFEVGNCALTIERSDERIGSQYVRGDYRWSAQLTLRDHPDRPLRLTVEMNDRLGVDSLCGWLSAMILEARSIAHLMLLNFPGMAGLEDSLALRLIGSLTGLTNQVGSALAEERKRAAERIRW